MRCAADALQPTRWRQPAATGLIRREGAGIGRGSGATASPSWRAIGPPGERSSSLAEHHNAGDDGKRVEVEAHALGVEHRPEAAPLHHLRGSQPPAGRVGRCGPSWARRAESGATDRVGRCGPSRARRNLGGCEAVPAVLRSAEPGWRESPTDSDTTDPPTESGSTESPVGRVACDGIAGRPSRVRRNCR